MHLRRAVRNLASKARFYGEIANGSVRSSSAAASTSSSFTKTALDISKVLGGRETYCWGSHAFHDIRYQIHQERSSLVEDLSRADGLRALFRGHSRRHLVSVEAANQFGVYRGKHHMLPCLVRTLASDSTSQASGKTGEDKRKDMSTIEDPFDAPTYHIPEKPVTFTEGASYSLIILAGLGIAGAAAYAVFKELIFEPKEYKIFGKALERVQNDSQVRVRIGSPVTGYGQESRNRAARQRIPHRVWTDEDGVEHVEVNFYIRGPHGAGKVYSEMFKDKTDKQWKFTYLIVEIKSPSPAQLMLESYVRA